jgi:superfamily II DNA or RNA helicase
MLESREYQDEALKAIEEEWAKGNTRTAVVLPTGMGKTIVFARLTKDRAALGKVLILVHRDELARSARDKLHSVAPELEIGIVKAERNDVDAPVIIGSVQTLGRGWTRRFAIQDVATIIVDEAHHAVAKTYLDILEHFGAFLPGKSPSSPGPTPTAGFSATLARDDHRGLGKVWQSVAYRKSIVWGIAKGYLSDVQAKRVVLDDLDLGSVPVNRGDYQEDELGRALLGIGAGPRIAEAWIEHAEDRQGFLFTPNVATAHQFAYDFRAWGLTNAVITGKTPIEERVNAYSRFQQGKIKVLVNCMVLTEGFDMPQASVACIARATRSRNLYVQMAGRVLRPWPGKPKALLLDVVGATQDQKLASIVDLSEDKLKEVKPDESITEAVDREAKEADSPVADLGGTLRAKDVDLFNLSSRAWLRTRKGVWFIPTKPGLWFLWPDPDQSGMFQVRHYIADDRRFPGIPPPRPESELGTMNEDEIVFENPPASRQGRGSGIDWQPIADQLRQRPGEWARVKRAIAGSYTSQISHGLLVSFAPAGTFEATWRKLEDATADRRYPIGDLYVRYVGRDAT